MSVSRDIARMWRAPREVVRRHLDAPRREGRALSYLVLGCLLVFVSYGPALARAVDEGLPGAGGETATLFEAVTYALFSWLILWPLLFYGIAALVHLALKLTGAAHDAYATRVALFWGFLAASPAALLYGLTAGLIGQGLPVVLTGGLWLGAIIAFAVIGLIEARRAAGV
ncbi:MAG: hypothetical protein CSA72_13475 [Rhodobacterales bacterium]|nr:MAG: hypothetical protein CSA72_13475 [Rhodobacterales bacterium]